MTLGICPPPLLSTDAAPRALRGELGQPGRGLKTALVGLCFTISPALCLVGCQTKASEAMAPDTILLRGVEASAYEGDELKARAFASSAELSADLARAHLRDPRLQLTHPALRGRADQATVQLRTLQAEGEGAVRIEGQGQVARAPRILIDGRAHSMELLGGVQVEGASP